MIDVTGDTIWFHGQHIATIHEDDVPPALLAEFIYTLRNGEDERKEQAYKDGHRDGEDEAAIDVGIEIEKLRAAMTEFCVKVEEGQARSTMRTYAKFCELLDRG